MSIVSRFLDAANIISNELQGIKCKSCLVDIDRFLCIFLDDWEDEDSSCSESGSECELVEVGASEVVGAGASAAADDCSEVEVSAETNLQTIIDRDGIDRLFPPLDGTAFYSLICRINHSCDPNVIVKYNVSEMAAFREPLQGKLYALRDIHPGEELVQSYIDQSLG